MANGDIVNYIKYYGLLCYTSMTWRQMLGVDEDEEPRVTAWDRLLANMSFKASKIFYLYMVSDLNDDYLLASKLRWQQELQKDWSSEQWSKLYINTFFTSTKIFPVLHLQ